MEFWFRWERTFWNEPNQKPFRFFVFHFLNKMGRDCVSKRIVCSVKKRKSFFWVSLTEVSLHLISSDLFWVFISLSFSFLVLPLCSIHCDYQSCFVVSSYFPDDLIHVSFILASKLFFSIILNSSSCLFVFFHAFMTLLHTFGNFLWLLSFWSVKCCFLISRTSHLKQAINRKCMKTCFRLDSQQVAQPCFNTCFEKYLKTLEQVTKTLGQLGYDNQSITAYKAFPKRDHWFDSVYSSDFTNQPRIYGTYIELNYMTGEQK